MNPIFNPSQQDLLAALSIIQIAVATIFTLSTFWAYWIIRDFALQD